MGDIGEPPTASRIGKAITPGALAAFNLSRILVIAAAGNLRGATD